MALRALFGDPSLFAEDRDAFEVVLPSHTGEQRWYVDHIEPVDDEHFKGFRWPGTEGFYRFATNGAGDQYLIDPCAPDPEVLYYAHETSAKTSLGVTLSAFLAAHRDHGEDE